MKGIILAGGYGTRLYPTTLGISKHLIPVYDKPMIYYPISVLMLAGISDILVIIKKEDEFNYKNLLGDGKKFGIKLSYAIQEKPEGIAQSLIIGAKFLGQEDVCLILGDNLFYGQNLSERLLRAKTKTISKKIGSVFASPVKNPSEFGVIEFGDDGKPISISEKPREPKSNLAVTGLYFYPNSALKLAKEVMRSARGEFEISDLNNKLLQMQQLHCEYLGRGFAWLDTGTCESLLEASQFVQTIENRQGYKIACLEEIAYRNGWLSIQQVTDLAKLYHKTEYGRYLSASINYK